MFLDHIQVTQEEANKESRERSHWVKLAKEMYACEDEDVLKRMIVVEHLSFKRPYIVQRIYAHYNKVRSTREKQELRTWKAKKTQKDTLKPE